MRYRLRDLKAVPTYFHDRPELGRTTKLVHAESGKVLWEVVGAVPLKELYAAYLDHKRREKGEGR